MVNIYGSYRTIKTGLSLFGQPCLVYGLEKVVGLTIGLRIQLKQTPCKRLNPKFSCWFPFHISTKFGYKGLRFDRVVFLYVYRNYRPPCE